MLTYQSKGFAHIEQPVPVINKFQILFLDRHILRE